MMLLWGVFCLAALEVAAGLYLWALVHPSQRRR
jgi:hypothetical protein